MQFLGVLMSPRPTQSWFLLPRTPLLSPLGQLSSLLLFSGPAAQPPATSVLPQVWVRRPLCGPAPTFPRRAAAQGSAVPVAWLCVALGEQGSAGKVSVCTQPRAWPRARHLIDVCLCGGWAERQTCEPASISANLQTTQMGVYLFV
uniref:Uncharacterized protein n=1 Tax=Molossus molossus TaxID=27622 RepID=A0A7J8CZQ5_MOLMO|nr:hypothetical protein HJG59_009548 [Molossus molossus]